MLDKLFSNNVEQTLEKHARRLEQLEAEVSRVAEIEERLLKLEKLQGEPVAGTREQPSADIIEVPEVATVLAQDSEEEAVQLAEKTETASLKQELEKAAAKLEEADTRNAELEARLAEAKAANARLEASLQEALEADQGSSAKLEKAGVEKNGLEAQLAEARLAALQAELQDVSARLNNLSRQNEVWQKLGLEVETGERMLQVFANIGAACSQIAASYYNLDDCLVFASQCGVVARLRQCWEGCRELALAGTPPAGAAAFLELALEFYNRAFPNNPCQLILAEAGEDFDYQRLDRLGPPGRKVAALVLPGFIMPNGSIGVKALVELK